MQTSLLSRVAHNIRKLRELKNFTQEYMAVKLMITATAYGKIERGETDISLSRLHQIAAILEIEYLRIFTFDEQTILSSPVQEKGMPSGEYLHLTAMLIRQLQEENQFLKNRTQSLIEMLGKEGRHNSA